MNPKIFGTMITESIRVSAATQLDTGQRETENIKTTQTRRKQFKYSRTKFIYLLLLRVLIICIGCYFGGTF